MTLRHHLLLSRLRPTPMIADIRKGTPRATKRLRKNVTKSDTRKAKNAATRRATKPVRKFRIPDLRIPYSSISPSSLQGFKPTRLPTATQSGRLSIQKCKRAFIFVGIITTIAETDAAVRTIEFVGI